MGRRSINTTKSGKYMNPTDQFRKEARKRELKKNKKQRIMVRTAVLKGKDPIKLLEEMEIIDRMEYDPMQPPSLNEKVLREKRKKLKETFDRVFKLYEKERPEYAVDIRKANVEYEKTRSQLQQHFDQVRNAERVQLDQIPLPDAPDDPYVPGAIPLPMEIPLQMPGMPIPMAMVAPPSILKKTSAYGPPVAIGPQMQIQPSERKPAGPPPGPPPDLSDSDDEEDEESAMQQDLDEEYDPEKGIVDQVGQVDIDMENEEELSSSRGESLGKSRRIRFADDEDDDEDDNEEEEEERRREREERRRRRKERKRIKHEEKESGKKKVSAVQAMMLKMAGQDTREFAKEVISSESESSESSLSDSDDDQTRRRRFTERREEDERIRSKDREIARRREEISRLDDRPPGVDDPIERMSDTESAAMAAARLAEEAELEAETRHLTPKVPPGPPPGLPPNMGGPQGLPPGPPPGAPPMFLRPPPMRGGPPGAPPRLMPPGPPPGRPQGLPPGPPPGLPPNIRASLMRIPTPMGVPPPRMMRPPGLLPPSIPPPQGQMGSSMNPNILSAPPSIRLRDGEDGSGPRGPSQSRVTIQAKPQIKSKMGDVTRFMPMALKVKRETRDQKGRLKQPNKEEEPRMIGVPSKPQPVPAAQAKTKDDAYDQFMKEMEGLI